MCSTPLSPQTKIKLNDGTEIPQIGLGVYDMSDDETFRAAKWALEAGYRMIDTAAWYENEAACGRAIAEFCKETGTPRSEIYYITKLKHNLGRESTRKSIQASLNAAGLEYIDLYLVHGPPGGPKKRQESWEEIEKVYKQGKLRSIGVSNFGVRHLKEMQSGWGALKISDDSKEWAGIKPSVNQVDLHPFMTREDIVGFCRTHDIALQAWAPLVRGMRFDHPVVTRIAKKHSKAASQVLLRYSLQRGYIAIPKSVSQARIKSNIDLYDFELSEAEISELHSLDERLVTDWEVTECE